MVGGPRWKSGERTRESSPWLVTDSVTSMHLLPPPSPLHSLPLRHRPHLDTTSIPIQWKKEGGRAQPPSFWPRINALFKPTCFFSTPLLSALFRPLLPSLFSPFDEVNGSVSRGSARGKEGDKAGGERGLPIPRGGGEEGRSEVCERCIVCHFFIHSWFCGRLAWRIRKNSSTPSSPFLHRISSPLSPSLLDDRRASFLFSSPPGKVVFSMKRTVERVTNRGGSWCYFIIHIVYSLKLKYSYLAFFFFFILNKDGRRLARWIFFWKFYYFNLLFLLVKNYSRTNSSVYIFLIRCIYPGKKGAGKRVTTMISKIIELIDFHSPFVGNSTREWIRTTKLWFEFRKIRSRGNRFSIVICRRFVWRSLLAASLLAIPAIK